MIIESHIGEKALLQIECASDSGINKGGSAKSAHPDRIVENMLKLVNIVHDELLDKIREAGVTGAEVEFGLRVDAGANVVLSMTPGEGQFKIRMSV